MTRHCHLARERRTGSTGLVGIDAQGQHAQILAITHHRHRNTSVTWPSGLKVAGNHGVSGAGVLGGRSGGSSRRRLNAKSLHHWWRLIGMQIPITHRIGEKMYLRLRLGARRRSAPRQASRSLAWPQGGDLAESSDQIRRTGVTHRASSGMLLKAKK